MNTMCYLHTLTYALYIHMTQVGYDVITLHFPPPSLSSPVVDTTTDQSQNGTRVKSTSLSSLIQFVVDVLHLYNKPAPGPPGGSLNEGVWPVYT